MMKMESNDDKVKENWQEILELLHEECTLTTSRSGGKGGQHVNKVETKVTLKWNVEKSSCFDEREKERIAKKLDNDINKDGELVLKSQKSRTQLGNRLDVLEKFDKLIEKSLKEEKKRKKTRPSKAAKEKKLKIKRQRSSVKKSRKKPRIDD